MNSFLVHSPMLRVLPLRYHSIRKLASVSTNNFITKKIKSDIRSGKIQQVVTRFPPEPNGCLHLGHAKSIFLNFEVSKMFEGKTYIRMDDTNPKKESLDYEQDILKDIQWLGFSSDQWTLTHTSDYFHQLYQTAEYMVENGQAYIDSSSAEDMKIKRGTLTQPGENSSDRDRSIDENKELLKNMRDGQYKDGEYTLRARIDMSSPNLNLRDPVLYRIIQHPPHHRTQYDWCIYPTYDFSHSACDALEGITHSLCSLEFQDHQPLYKWVVENMPPHLLSNSIHPQQIEYSRLHISHTYLSKRKLTYMIQNNYVNGWDDPRLSTLKGMRRRGFTPECIKEFCKQAGISKAEGIIHPKVLEDASRFVLNKESVRIMAALNPIELCIKNWPKDLIYNCHFPYHPSKPQLGTRNLEFKGQAYVDKSDISLNPVDGWKRLAIGQTVRLKHCCDVICDEIYCNNQGEIESITCTYIPEEEKEKNKKNNIGVITWLPYDNYEKISILDCGRLIESHDKDSEIYGKLEQIDGCMVEGNVNEMIENFQHFQFERIGYFCYDQQTSSKENKKFIKTVSLRENSQMK